MEPRELRKPKRRIRELKDEVETLRQINALLSSSAQHPKGPPGDRRPRQRRVLEQSLLQSSRGLPSGLLPLPATPNVADDHAPRTAEHGQITRVHAESRGTYGLQRVRVERIQGRGSGVSERLVWR